MLYVILYEQLGNARIFGLNPFRLFGYVSFRTVGGAVTAFVVCLLLGPWVIRLLARWGIHEQVEKNPDVLKDFNNRKKNVPTMGGMLMVASVIVSTLIWGRLDHYYVVMGIFVVLFLGLVGLADDWIKLKRPESNGLKMKVKFGLQLLLGVVLGLLLLSYASQNGYEKTGFLMFPFLKNAGIYLGIFYILLVMVVVAGSSNAVNLTDGMDGLATGCMIIVGLGFVVFCYVVGRPDYSAYLNITYVPGSCELTVFCAALVGAALGFLWHNCHPAQVFMGDVGALALGGAVGYVAVVLKHELVLFIAGGVFVMEALSVLLQVGYFKRTGKRIFLIAPLHYHYQKKGWSETQVTVRFWLLSAIFVLLSLATLKIR
ncbi:MAG: phospho-N-acetylmuramoyl-pentapeptide-transferase [Planctomycetota bacterium]|nr:MAG: phospho-N-acetylmuramoyl-pentapeptide-transferase [Planctomycetota bacterium]